MATFILMVEVLAFLLLAPSWIYGMFAYPYEFGPKGPRACDMKGYSPAPGDELVKKFTLPVLKGVWTIIKNIFPFIEWFLHAEFMTVHE
jgi:hypothetical protein